MPDIHRFSHEAMTTTFDVLIIHDEKAYAKQAANAVFDEINRLERMLSRHDPGSDIGQVNRLKPGQWMAVTLEVLECLEIAARAYMETGGAFDAAFRSTHGGTRPSATDCLLLSRPDQHEPSAPAQFLVGIAPDAAASGFESAELDLGGIGKGYALDKAVQIMDDWQIDNYLLNSGTSTVLAQGPGPVGEGWPVGVSGDYRDITGVARTLLLNHALSGSGTAVKGEHIRVPATGDAAPAIAAWVKAPTAAWTDAISTALMVLPREKAEELLNRNSASAAARETASKAVRETAAVIIYPAPQNPAALVTGNW